MKRIWLTTLLIFGMAGIAVGQTTTTSFTTADPDGVAWNAGTYSIQYQNATPGKPYNTSTGQFITTLYTGTLNSSGALSLTLDDVQYVSPANGTWIFTICPDVSGGNSNCATISIPVTGTSENVSSQINAVLRAPRPGGGVGAYGYADVEFQSIPGNTYVVSPALTAQRCYAGSWAACGGGGGGSLPTSNALGDQLFATAPASTTYVARTTSKIPVELYGATPYTSEAAAEAGPDDTAKFQSAVTGSVLGVVTCQSGMWYHVEGPVNFISNEGLIGTSNQTYGGQCNLVTNSASTKVLSAVGSSGSYLAGVTWANLAIFRSTAGTGTSSGFYSSFNGGAIVTNTRSYDSIYDYYRHASPGFGLGYWSYDQAGWLLAESSGTFYGFYDDSADGNAENSIILTHSGAACQNFTGSAISYGQILTGTAVNDNDSFDFNTAGCSYGQAVNFTGSGTGAAASDIHFYGSTHDNFRTEAFYVNGVTAAQTGSVEISGGWAVAGPQTSSVNGALYILNSSGVSINHVQIGAHQGSGAPAVYGVNIAGGGYNTVANNTIMAQNYAVNLTNNTVGNVVTGNTDTNATGSTINIGMQINNGSTYNTLIGNSFNGPNTITTGITITSGSNNNTYVGNNCGSGVTTCISDSGTGNGFISVGAFPFTNNAAASAFMPSVSILAPNMATTDQTYVQLGRDAVSNYDLSDWFYVFVGAGSTSNHGCFGLSFASGCSFSYYPNLGSEFGETTPALPPANGIAVGTTGQFIVTGAGIPILPHFIVSALPAVPAAGGMVVVTDATTFTGGTCVGSGSDTVLAISNGTSWVCQ